MSATTTDTPLTFGRPSGVRTVKNGLATVFVTLATLLTIIPLAWVLTTVIIKGYRLLLSSTWWLQSQRGITPRREGGGAYHAIVGTVEMALICAAIAVPLGVLAAIFLIEYGRGTKIARGVSFMVDILSGIPSIVAALFIYALFITIFGWGRSAIAVSCALVLLMLPVVLRSTEEMLKLVPDSLREASYALGREMEDHCEGSDSDGIRRHHHWRHAWTGKGDGRDSTPADPCLVRGRHQLLADR
jgi:phosphate transport system permease protein